MQRTPPTIRRHGAPTLVAAFGLVATALLVTLSGAAATAAEVPVAIEDYSYAPAAVTVATGDTVTWTNSDTAPHTVTSDDGGPLDSPTMQQGDSWSFTFTQSGTYSYYCVIHPDMTGSVTVTAPTTTTTAHDGHEATTTTAAPTTSTTTAPPPAEPEPVDPPAEGAPGCNESGLLGGVVDPFWEHFQGAHLETSPGQQAADALDVDQYAVTHTVLFEHMLQPVVALVAAVPEAFDPFWAHFEAAHLERSPGAQAGDALDVDQYVLTHTVLFEHMLDPAASEVAGGC